MLYAVGYQSVVYYADVAIKNNKTH